MFWDRIIQWNKIYHFITVIMMGLWRIIFFIWASKIIVVDGYGMFLGVFNKTLQETFTPIIKGFVSTLKISII